MQIASGVYTDFAGLEHLRAGARRNSPEALRTVAARFEALFLQMMMKSMREANPGDPLLGGADESLYRDLFDHQLSLDLAEAKGIGLADMLIRQLGQFGTEYVDLGRGQVPTGREHAALDHSPKQLEDAGKARAAFKSEQSQGAAPVAVSSKLIFDSPEDFVRTLLPEAQQAGRALGVDPSLLVAQAALETGWGKAMPRHADGRISYNLFGIKADRRWDGAHVTVPTLEHIDGVMVRVQAPFRAYGSFAESFEDYVSFLSGQPRYAEALGKASDPEGYIRALQSAGYATDPQYADKVIALMRDHALSSL